MADGRDTRWAAHREARRLELVEHALRAIREFGPGVGMDEIAARAQTSKTVLYRHFADRAGLHGAVTAAVHDYIHSDLSLALGLIDAPDLPRIAALLADAYLALVERDPEIYRFVLAAPPGVDPLGGLPERIAEDVAAVVWAQAGDPERAAVWAHGLVGFVRAVADRWMAADPRPARAAVVANVGALFTLTVSADL